MSNQTNKEIAHEVGQEVYVKGTIIKTYPEQGFVDVLLKDGANVPLGTPAYDTSQIVPVPREGEYRLTIEELVKFGRDFHAEYYDLDVHMNQNADAQWFVKQWLERKEGGND